MLDSFFLIGAVPANAVKGTYILDQVFASYTIATIGAYIAITLAAYIFSAPTVWEKRQIHWVGAFALGLGIWSMHFIGMLSYQTDMVMQYDPWLTYLSFAVAIVSAYGVLQIVRNPEFSVRYWIAGSVGLGFTICAMHYTGMAAMQMDGDIHYIPWLFCLSVAISIGASAVALLIIFNLRQVSGRSRILWRILASLIMGAAVCGMHYTGNAAAVMIPTEHCHLEAGQNFDTLADDITIGTGVIYAFIFGYMFLINQRRNLALMEERVRHRTLDLEEAMKQLKQANQVAEEATQGLRVNLEKAEEASKAKSNFLANMSHELRTPMNGVLGMAQLLAGTSLNTEQKEYVTTINGSAENLLALLNDILDLSKIEAGALVLEHIPFELRNIVSQTLGLLRAQTEKKHIDLRMDIEEDVPDYMWGDPARFRQIVTNLIGNAVKFTAKGYVRLMVSVQEREQGKVLLTKVEDTGMGIPAHKHGEIFEKFTQGDASVTRKYGGTGLGLAITKQLVAMMDGAIGVESVEGKGSTFWFTIPCKVAHREDMATQVESHNELQHGENLKPAAEARVLLVEDYPVNKIFAEKLLRKFGFTHIDVAENGVEAFLKYRTAVYDMIFMDCQMPELDGYQATQKLRTLEEGTPLRTPIIAMTANAMMGDREKCLKAGMDDYISKPLRVHHLQKILEKYFALPCMGLLPALAMPPSKAIEETQEAPVDMEQLRIFTNGSAAEEKALGELFVDQAVAMINVLRESVASDKKDAWKSASHRLKGSAGNLGAMKLQHLCKRAEANYEDDEAKKLEMLMAIRHETTRVESYLSSQVA